MFFNRKKKLSPVQAASLYLDNLHQIIENTWTIDVETINDIYPNYSLLPNKPHIKVDLMLCIVSLELQVISNRYPEKKNVLEQGILYELTNNYSNGSKGVDVIVNDYLPEIEYAVRKMLSPIDAAIHVFVGRLNLDVDVNVDLLKKTALTQLIVTKIGTWNNIFKEYNIN